MLIPVLAFFLIRFFAQQDFQGSAGSTILYRIGIAGNDIHNGGLIGALQFLGGNRITQCIEGINISNLSQDMSIKIAMFNCLLSILGMIFLSVLSIFGCYLLIKNSPFAKLVFLTCLVTFSGWPNVEKVEKLIISAFESCPKVDKS